ncbi:hypothetical protein HK099_001316 [Clydaea vesicula]|uniref:Glutamate--cysteine ligase n=1 Tax=Clydaea vesicula TaxID=447962 RepID=A0AAD5Y1A3_9FUNG|nr:hypothetical protein HK099_001316 [Clydaea vesicula]
MGLLSLGTPLPWEEAKKYSSHVRNHGIIQFVNIWNRVKSRRRDHLLWGDEVEYMVVDFDHEKKKVKLALTAYDALQKMEKLQKELKENGKPSPSTWHPEYGRYMLEGTPGSPYGSTLKNLLDVEQNMIERRELAKKFLGEDQEIMTITNFPLLGVEDFVSKSDDINTLPTIGEDGISRSLFIPDCCINPHARFATLTKNIRTRRGAKIFINVPIFKDKNTPSPFKEALPLSIINATDEDFESIRKASNSDGRPILPLNRKDNLTLPDVIPDAQPDSIYLDAMCFGMGCSCLQVTFQACSVEEARRLYDQLAVLTPIMLALTAAAPIYRGYLSDVDCRWNIIAASVDDRTQEERGVKNLENCRFRIKKSRYDSINSYLSPGPSYSGGCGPEINRSSSSVHGDFFKHKYDDLNPAFDDKIYRDLLDAGVDNLLAKHYAHLFIRDPLVVFKELLDQDDNASSDHFENIQSTNWQTMRFKPPSPTTPNIGWRVEFRSMEIQLSDFENAAFSIFVVLLTRTILSFDLNFYAPLSKVDENLKKAQKRGNVNNPLSPTTAKSFCDPCDPDSDVRRGQGILNSAFGAAAKVSSSKSSVVRSKENLTNGVMGNTSSDSQSSAPEESSTEDDDAVELMSIDEIINGKEGSFVGLIPLILSYLNSMPLEHNIVSGLERYVDLVKGKANGSIPTTASWIRNFVLNHPDYKQDSVVGQKIAYDLMMESRKRK